MSESTKKVTRIERRTQVRSYGIAWHMDLEKWSSASGKSSTYLIYHQGGQSYPVGTYRSITAARKVLDSFTNYTLVSQGGAL